MPPPRSRQRLGGLNRPRRPPPRKQDHAVKVCPAPNCGSTEFTEDDGLTICKHCYTQINESNIVAEVTFEEQTGGRATVQGGTVNDNSRHARTLGAGAYRKVGGGERNTLADIQNAGRRALEQLCPKLGITDNVSVQANQIWTLAANINFSAGRKTDEVVAACLYAACRRQTNNQILLMDIAELVHINVFRLGEVYKDMCKELYINNENIGHQHLIELEPLIHKYCEKLQFAEKTKQVAEDALKIIKRMNRDWIVSGRHPAGLCGACIILAARMNNFQRSVREVVYVSKVADVTIAKRIEEFRVTKSASLTVQLFREIGNRIVHQHDPPSFSGDMHTQRLMANRKRKRAAHMLELEERASQARSQQPIDIPDDATDASSRLSSVETTDAEEQSRKRQKTSDNIDPALTKSNAPMPTPPDSQQTSGSSQPQPSQNEQSQSPAPPQQDQPEASSSSTSQPSAAPPRPAPPHRVDADGFVIPDIPVQRDPTPLPVDKSATIKRGRKPKAAVVAPTPIEISQEELAEEDYLEKQIEAALENDQVQDNTSDVAKAKAEEKILLEQRRAQASAEIQQKLDAERTKSRRVELGIDVFGEPTEWQPGEVLTAEQLEKEFENDPEVENCMLSEAETKIKEQIWVAHNEDWLRKQAERDLMAKVNPPSAKGRASKLKKNGKPKRKHSRMGDGSVLTEGDTPIETPEDAARAMLEKRAPMKSQHVDFSALQRIYGREGSVASSSGVETSADATRAGTPADATRQSATPAPESEIDASSPPPGSEDGEEDEVEEDTRGGAARRLPSLVEEAEEPAADFAGADWPTANDEEEVVEEEEEEELEMDEFGVIGGFEDLGDDEGEEYE
ncbi:unnamed protein product [Zymoseptoria tritici ST99CH_1A5]|uniref:Cyclin-like domain-containing protein n=3 Tax=Zymoseptoria tritici TaxID=1047171 RepID=A0A1X7RJQ2_ZYMT9|nr:unnamed protein product [Zymoseptoria tritici ST99CH_3D7]SMR46186.1 unnamed protein product [Zymoseptoria tritici ST99CH_1E4]SMY21336.1 unnamed protein product [Zymoseptoria tritici ST99CH_1A5]